MRLTELCKSYKGTGDPEIRGIASDSRRVEPGWLFAALPGTKTDGGRYIEDAVRNGAVAVLAAPGTKIPASVAPVTDENPHRAFSLIAARFYGRQPDRIAAVTGTNGKTSTVTFAQQIWQRLGYKAASLGTLGVRGPGIERYGSLTTPDPAALHAELADLAAAGIDHLALEASSHGLAQHRLDGVKVSAAGFTNLTRDHLDYHGTMEGYFDAKARLFAERLDSSGAASLNADVPEFVPLKKICAERKIRVFGYGRKGEALKLLDRKALPQGQAVALEIAGKKYDLVLPLVGAFQVMNVLCALGLIMADFEDAARLDLIIGFLAHLKGAPGRLQLISGHPAGAAVYVDYAHTPDALQNALEALRPHTEGRLVCIAGCGGDRDPGKRPIMGKIAATISDLAVITDDNPRTENPAKIRAAMMSAAPGAREIGGRREAIGWAVEQLKAGDVLLIAGKGHERGQIIGERVEPFDDVEEAQKAILALRKRRAS